jgi:hypothetical protein
MKPAKYVMKIVMWLMMLGIAAYFVVYTLNYLWASIQTEPLYTYTAEETITVNGYLFRDEEPIPSEEALVEVTVGEGERVAVGGELALVYDDQSAMASHEALVSMENELEVLAYIRSHSADDADGAQLNSEIADAIVNLHLQTQRRTLGNLSDATSALKNLIYRQDYTYNGNEALDTQITTLRAEIADLSGRVGKNISSITAQRSGLFSSQVDGYENVMTMDAVQNLTPSGLEALVNARESVDEDAYLGKLIYGNEWYYVTTMDEESAKSLQAQGSVTLRFNSIGDQIFQVDSVSQAEEGQVVVVFSTQKYLSDVTLLRDQTVEVVLDTVTGYHISTSAVRILENTVGETGVYRVYGTQAVWVPVEVLYRGEDYYLIRQTVEYNEDGSEKELSTLQQAKQLRDGAEIIVQGRDLYDGKIIE